jgi:hypothetical protein
MKIYGRTQDSESELILLSESTLIADPNTLRELASFLYRCADNIEDLGESWEHDNFENIDAASPQFAVFNPLTIEANGGS